MEKKQLYTINIKGWDDSISGIMESFTDKWVLIKRISCTYVFDGLTLVQRRHIKSCERNDDNKFREKVLAVKGVMDIPVPDIPLDERLAPIEWLCSQKKVVEFHIEDESKFFVGKVDKVQTNIIRWFSIDNRAIWDPVSDTLQIKTIVSIDIDTNYVIPLLAYHQVENGKIGKLCSFTIKGWDDTVTGIVCAVSSEWVLIKQIIGDFRYDGFALIRSKYIDLWNRDKGIPFRQEVLEALGVMDMPVPEIPLSDLNAPLLWLLQQKNTLSFTFAKEYTFRVGDLLGVEEGNISYRALSLEGEWLTGINHVSINSIRLIEWKSEYIQSLLLYTEACSKK